METECGICHVVTRGNGLAHSRSLKHIRAYVATFGEEAAVAAYGRIRVARATVSR